ncbi:MAG: hypothetical protein KAT35_05415 [Candidatus Aenigmarchaeota archaeon]|nr:hypothetical protein [Candidatus Aenigmarchaeota archaeon]
MHEYLLPEYVPSALKGKLQHIVTVEFMEKLLYAYRRFCDGMDEKKFSISVEGDSGYVEFHAHEASVSNTIPMIKNDKGLFEQET